MWPSRTARIRSQPVALDDRALLHRLPAPRRDDDLGILRQRPPPGGRSGPSPATRGAAPGRSARRRRSRPARPPSRCRRSAARPIPRRTRADGGAARAAPRGCRRARARAMRPASSAASCRPTSAPTIRIICRISATLRWLNVIDRVAAANQLGGDVRLQIGEGEDQVRLQRLDLVEARVDERRHLRLAPRLGRPHGVARDADDAVAFAEEIQRLGRFLGEADDAMRILSDTDSTGFRESLIPRS